LTLALIWGSSFLFIKVAVTEIAPAYVAFFRVALGAVTLLVIVAITRQKLPRDRKLWGHLAVVAFIGNVIPFALFAYGEQEVSSGIAGIWNATTPLVMMPVMLLFFRSERLTRAKVAGLLVGFAGVMVVLGVWQGIGAGTLTGNLLCFGAASSYAFGAPYMRQHLTGRDIPGVALAAGQITMAAIELAVLAPIMAGPPPALASLSWSVIAALVALGAFGTGIAFVLNYHVIRVVGVSTLATVTYLMPIVAVTMGFLVLGEEFSWYQPVGALIVLSGVAIAQEVPARVLARLRQRQLATAA
jgi:drug/metabolite transporter (DMT)-like permease